MKNTLILALALSGLTLVGCAEEETTTVDPIVEDAEVVTPAEDDLLLEEDTLVTDPMMADSTMMEGEVMADTTAM